MTTQTHLQPVINLDERVRDSLRNRILSGELEGGAHLSELKLSKDFNVSRTPIREALCALAADGLIEMLPHRGAFVRTVSTEAQQDQHFMFTQLMGLAARMASDRMGIENMMLMETAINNLKNATKQNFAEACRAVNTSVRQAAQSDTLDTLMNVIERRMLGGYIQEEAYSKLNDIQQEYAVLLGSFKRKKSDVAEKTMRQIMSLLSNTPVQHSADESSSEQTAQLN